jgi:hypothetical protein
MKPTVIASLSVGLKRRSEAISLNNALLKILQIASSAFPNAILISSQ